MRIGFIVATLLVSVGVFAESQPAQAPPSPYPLVVVPPPPQTGPTIFDDNFFDPEMQEPVGEETRTDATGKRRYIDSGFARQNKQNIREDKAACAGQKDDPDAYGKCIKGRRAERNQRLNQSQQAVENRQSKPLRNVPRVPTGN